MYREKIDSYIEAHKEDMLADLSALVRIDSQRGEAKENMPFGEGPARVLAAAKDMLDAYGLKTTNYDNYVLTGDFGEGDKKLDILAHLDVVPVTEDWTVTAPFEPKIVGDRIYGRGTSDDKGPAIAALYAIRAIKELGIPLKRSVRLILGSDEECGSGDLEHYYSIEKEAECTFTPDADFPVINLEKARLAKPFTAKFDKSDAAKAIVSLEGGSKVNVVPGTAKAVLKGFSAAELEAAAKTCEEKTGAKVALTEEAGNVVVNVKGTSAHGSTPEEGNNAVVILLSFVDGLDLEASKQREMISNVLKLFPYGDTEGKALGVNMSDEKSGALSMNLGILRISETELYGEFDSRAPLCANDENLTAVMAKKFAEAGIRMEEGAMTPAHYVPEESDFVQTLLKAYEAYTGKEGKCLYTGGGTYVHELERGVAFGCMSPEVDNHMHGDDEFMEIPTLIMSAKLFAEVIVKLCG